MSDQAKRDFDRYEHAQRCMQSGVAGDQAVRGAESSKHLRVGVNTALVDHASLVRLLVAKGIFTEEEYAAAIAEGMEAEVKRYEDRLGLRLGPAGSVPGGAS